MSGTSSAAAMINSKIAVPASGSAARCKKRAVRFGRLCSQGEI
jgi:hypothetical protein